MIAAIILAGGESRRMGKPKLLLTHGGETLLKRAIRVAQAASDSVYLVLGAYPYLYAPEGEGATLVHNPDWTEGLASSLRTGVAALPPDVQGALIILPDQPFVTSDHLLELRATHQRTGAPLVFSDYGDTLGVPALLHKSVFLQVQTLKGDVGARALLKGGLELARVRLEKPVDIDTVEDVARYLE